MPSFTQFIPEIARSLAATKKTLKHIVPLNQNSLVRFAAIAFNLDKKEIDGLCKRYKLPNNYRELALLVVRLKNDLLPLSQHADGLVTLLEHADAYRKLDRLSQALLVCRACNKKLIKAADRLLQAYKITKRTRLTPKVIAMADKSKLRQILHDKRKKQVDKQLFS